MIRRRFAAAPPPRGIDDLALCHRHQPRFRIVRNAFLRPVGKGCCESLRQGILGAATSRVCFARKAISLP